jgi:hydroxymethylpyrimidine pyrophosphatase-like HAD family hydrolase
MYDSIENEHVICIDIDDTLIYWQSQGDRPTVTIKSLWREGTFEVNQKMLENIEQHYQRKHFIILWSQSGYEWCQAVASALKIEDKIDLCMTKPFVAYDDLPLDEWCRRIIP